MSEVKSAATRKFGIDFVGDIEWGTHLCQFYQTKKDLVDILVSYFAEGLRSSEFCVWVTSPPLEVAEARRALRKAVPDLDRYIEKGQIEILSYTDWYLLGGGFDADRVLQGWVDKEKNALERGLEGLRLTGNTFWIERNNWKSFANYEAMLNNVIGSHKMIALCTYSLRKCSGSDVIDVVRNHLGTLIRKGKTWNLFEDVAERKKAEGETRSIARFPSENPNPVLRIAGDGTILYSNPAGLLFLKEWNSGVGELAPDKWRALVSDSLSSETKKEFDENYGQSSFSFLMVPVSASGYVNMYGSDITKRKQAEEALQEKQRDLNHAQAVAKTGSWRLDVRRNELLWSGETYRMFGIPEGTPLTYEIFLGKVHADDREYVDQKWQAALRGEPYDVEHRIMVDREVKWVRERAELEFDKDAVLLGGFGAVQDITELKRTENALKEASDYLESLLNYASAPVITWDPEFKVTKFNHAFEHLSGYKAEEVLGKHLSVLFPEKSREESLTEIQHTLAGEQWEGVEIPILRKDGNVRTVLWNSANIHAADGATLMATIAQGQDITERKQLEEKLYQSERKYRSLYETSIDGIVSVDMEGRITECNDAYSKMLGYSKDELKDMTYIQLTPEKWHQMEQEIIREHVIKRGHSDLYEKEYTRKDGSIVTISIRTWLVRDEKWTPIGMWAIVRDVTRRKQLEDELKRYSEHLEHLVDERTKKLKDAERLAAIGETAAMVGHDIRNPLQTVEGAIYLAKEEIRALPSRTREVNNIEEMLNAIHEETTYVNKIVSDLQDYARPLAPELEEIDTKQLINSALTTTQIPSTIEVSVTVDQDCCTLIVDPTMMKRILSNLITNALQAMPNGGKLTIASFRKQDQVHISVQDMGQGIPEENRAKIFEPLFSTKAKGQGFGLAVVKRLVEAHHGTITFSTEVGKGTTFTFAIPLAKEAD